MSGGGTLGLAFKVGIGMATAALTTVGAGAASAMGGQIARGAHAATREAEYAAWLWRTDRAAWRQYVRNARRLARDETGTASTSMWHPRNSLRADDVESSSSTERTARQNIIQPTAKGGTNYPTTPPRTPDQRRQVLTAPRLLRLTKKGLTTPVVPLHRAPIKLELDHIQIVHCQKYRACEDVQLTTSLTQFPTTGLSTLPERSLMEFDFKTLTVMANR